METGDSNILCGVLVADTTTSCPRELPGFRFTCIFEVAWETVIS
jgi:hypothetical protein